MKFSLPLVALLTLNSFPSFAAEPGPACTAKRVAIESELSDAKARGIRQEIAGLNRALRANKANCTDASLARDRDARIKKAQRKLAEREKELASAQNAGKVKAIEKRRAKLEDARRELADAEKPLVE